MNELGVHLSYSMGVFLIVFISGCIVNLFKEHYIFQIIGIALFFTFSIIKSIEVFDKDPDATARVLFLSSLPMFAGISACLLSMAAGFWIFPIVRKKFKV